MAAPATLPMWLLSSSSAVLCDHLETGLILQCSLRPSGAPLPYLMLLLSIQICIAEQGRTGMKLPCCAHAVLLCSHIRQQGETPDQLACSCA